MNEELIINDFTAGLISSDDDINGRKNGFVRLENVELDQNGAIVLTGGTVRLNSAYPNDLHTIFSKFLGAGTPESPQYQYGTDNTGITYRNNTNIGSGGSTTRTAFVALFEYVLFFSGNIRKKDDGTTASNIGQGTASTPAVALDGAGVLTGAYQYIQVNVFVNAAGGYQAKSAPSPLVSITTSSNQVKVTPTNVSGIQNEVWIFRRGGTLPQYYRIARITSAYTTPFDDNMADQDAINAGVTTNPLALPTDSTNLPDAILEAVGPVNLRTLLFTAKTVFFSELNSPESYIPGQGVYFMGAPQTAETFLWARKLANNVVIIGTTRDLYRVTGTYIEQSDGTLDVSIKPLGVDGPPISLDADIYNNQLVYMCSYGWVIVDQYGATIPLCPPNVDVNYYGKTRYGILGVPIWINSPRTDLRYTCAVIRNKLFCAVPEGTSIPPVSHRVDVWDFIRKYWRSIRYVSDAAPLLLKGQEDETVIGYFASDKFIKRLDDQLIFTFDNGPAVNQTIRLVTPFYDCGTRRNRKDAATLKLKIDTGNTACAMGIYINDAGLQEGGGGISLGNITANGLTEIEIDLNTPLASVLVKNFQVSFSGTVPVFRLCDISFVYTPRPVQQTYLKLPVNDFGISSKKRVRTWPFVLDTLGNTVTFVPNVDSVDQPSTTFSTTGRQTVYYFFTTDIFGVDFTGKFTCPGLFEIYKVGEPEIVQILPTPKRFDQVGPEDLMRYGKIRQFDIRLIAFGGTIIPYTLYLQDASVVTGNLSVVDSVEDTYNLKVPKTSAGDVARFTLGPTSFNFHRIYIRAQVVKSGAQKDSEMEWVILGNGSDGLQNS